MKVSRLVLIFLLLSVIGHLSSNIIFAAPAYPLKKSANNRYFVDQNNNPFFINGDTPWSLIGQVSYEDAVLYLNDAATRGFNSLIVTLVEGYYADNAPANYYDTQPYTTPGKFSTPNENYFIHADRILNYAASKGIQIILAPNYLGWNGGGDGWWNELDTQNSVEDARLYGEWVGERYKNFPNLMYVWVNDTNPCGYNSDTKTCVMKDKIAAMAAGVKAKDPNHLHTAHLSPEYSAVEHFSTTQPYNGFTIDFNITYSYNPIQGKVLQDYNRANPIVPFFMFESHYEWDWANAPPIQIRRQAYNATLSGAAGHHYGNNPIWHMNGRPGDDTTSWKQHLNDEGRADMANFRALFESRSWHTLVPDQTHTVITAGYGSGDNYVGAASTADQGTTIAYLPGSNTVTVNLNQISGTQTKAWWFNPRTGTAQLLNTFSDSTTQIFTAPDPNDWVLVLDDAALNLPAPGSSVSPSPTPFTSPQPTGGGGSTDLDGDADTDWFDLSILISHFHQLFAPGNFNLTGLVDIFDLNTLIQNL